jgi:hypothetical protein
MASILGYPQPGEKFVGTDVSSVRIDGMLSQAQKGQECIVASYSWTLSKAERNYCVT